LERKGCDLNEALSQYFPEDAERNKIADEPPKI
jgi:hypothetical protein